MRNSAMEYLARSILKVPTLKVPTAAIGSSFRRKNWLGAGGIQLIQAGFLKLMRRGAQNRLPATSRDRRGVV
jgi:hypothetical protein